MATGVNKKGLDYPGLLCTFIFMELSIDTQKLFNQLVNDLKSTLPPNERVYDKKNNPALIYNLFQGKYKFTYNQYKELLGYLYN